MENSRFPRNVSPMGGDWGTYGHNLFDIQHSRISELYVCMGDIQHYRVGEFYLWIHVKTPSEHV